MGRPKYRVGSSASINPPVQAQSAGLQKMLCVFGSLGRLGVAPDVPAPIPALPRAGAGVSSGGSVSAVGSNPNQFWLQTKPGRLPMRARWGMSAPLGGPVVPLV